MPSFDCIVAGCGGIGSAALYHLAQRGHSVLGLDQFAPGHDRGSSHGETRIIRQAYFEHPSYVPLLKEAYALWEDLAVASGRNLYHETGVLQIGPEDGEVVPGVLASATQHDLDVERIDPAAFARTFPGFVLPEGTTALFEARGGYLQVEDCVRTHIEQAERLGAQLRADEPMLSFSADTRGVRVTTARETYTAAALVIAAGAWSGQLLSALEIPLTVLRKHLHWYASDTEAYLESNGCPVFFYELGERCFYGFPQRDALGVKVSEHSGGELITDPATLSRQPDPRDRQDIEAFLGKHLPAVSRRPLRHDVCMYTMSPDQHFVVDTYPASSNVCFAAGLSGHGFKFASVLGAGLADLATGTARPAMDFLRLNRFAAA